MIIFKPRYLLIAILAILIIGAGIVALQGADADELEKAISACKGKGPQTQQCLNELVVERGKSEGLEAGFDALSAVYMADPEFAANCHGTTHELGIQAFDVFEQGGKLSLNEKTSYCGFGFFHGFMEILLQSGKDLSEARKFCEQTIEELRSTLMGIPAACYHGIGHGVVDGTDPEKWGDASLYIKDGIALCYKLTTDEENQERCASGVFNALAIAYSDPKYKLSPDPKDPYAICREQEKEFSRDSCYDQMNGFVVRLYPEFKEALRIAEGTSEPAYRETAIGAVAGYRAQPALVEKRDLAEFVRDCDVLSEKWRERCANSFAVGLIEFGKPKQEFILAVDTCVGTGDLMHACLRGVTDAVRVRLEPSLHDVTCDYIAKNAGEEEGKTCRDFMSS